LSCLYPRARRITIVAKNDNNNNNNNVHITAVDIPLQRNVRNVQNANNYSLRMRGLHTTKLKTQGLSWALPHSATIGLAYTRVHQQSNLNLNMINIYKLHHLHRPYAGTERGPPRIVDANACHSLPLSHAMIMTSYHPHRARKTAIPTITAIRMRSAATPSNTPSKIFSDSLRPSEDTGPSRTG